MRNLPHGLDIYYVNEQSMWKIAQIFVAFSKTLIFNQSKSQILLNKNSLLRDLYAMTLAIPAYLSTYYTKEKTFANHLKAEGATK